MAVTDPPPLRASAQARTDAELEAHIMRQAREHDGRYLLRNRYRSHSPPSDLDRQYEACERIVDRGNARWIPRSSSMAPGIEILEHD